jgi:dienelactone hydrolase
MHGDRAKLLGRDPGIASERRWWRENLTDEMVEDWQATIDALQKLDGIGIGPVGYWGLSMGTIFGLPFVAAEPRVQVAVLGLMGAMGPTRDRLRKDAARVDCPVLFLVQWDDDLVPRESALELFGALGATDKRLHAHPGIHTAVPREEFDAGEAFLAEHLETDPSAA